MYRTLLLPALGALALVVAASPGHAATEMNADWQAYEQAYGSTTPPATDADCARYATDVVRNECMSRMHHQPTFTSRLGDSRANADQAAIRYCTKIGKTYELQGQSADKQLITYSCK
jgi:hypothetical protein